MRKKVHWICREQKLWGIKQALPTKKSTKYGIGKKRKKKMTVSDFVIMHGQQRFDEERK